MKKYLKRIFTVLLTLLISLNNLGALMRKELKNHSKPLNL